MSNKNRASWLLLPFICLFLVKTASAQSELEPWGNLAGIRVHGQLFEVGTSLRVMANNGRGALTYKEKQRPIYTRNGNKQIVTTNIDSLYFKETVEDIGTGKISVNVNLILKADTTVKGVYFCISLPVATYGNDKIQLIDAYADSLNTTADVAIISKGVKVTSAQHKFSVNFKGDMPVIIKKEAMFGENNIQLYVPIAGGALHKGDSVQKSFIIKVSGEVKHTPVDITIDTSKPGRPFDGLGGNFRLQNPWFDPEVIDYSLKNLRVAWGRVEMPWRMWQPNENTNPADTALRPAVIKAMEMAQRLNKLGIPIILSAWFPPSWAVIGKVNFRPVNGVWGNALNPDKMNDIYKSITNYIIYLKDHYGVEPKLFSFNESDLGINVRLTGEEHDELIKGLGAYFEAHGLKTKMLLGDNSDATTYKFIYPALNDPAAQPYIGAISFHSWRGWTTEILQHWADAAKQINKPLLVGEGSIDAQAWGYPQIFKEPTYALQEINLYTRLLNICQPLSILQWQLTTDYSPLIGGGIFGNNEPLHPGQRFWNLKQLASTPEHLYAMPVSCSATDVSSAALGDNDKHIYTLHLVNNGTTRKVTIIGLPANLKTADLYLTNQKEAMKEAHPAVNNGQVTFKMKATSYYTLICK